MTGRVWGSWALLVVAWLLLLASLLAVWTRSVLLDADRFAVMLSPVLRDEQVLEAVGERVSAGVITAPGGGGPLAGRAPRRRRPGGGPDHDLRPGGRAGEDRTPAAPGASAATAAGEVRTAHAGFVNVLRGRSDVAVVSDGTLTLNLLPLVREVMTGLPGGGSLLAEVRLPDLGTDEAPTAARRRLEAAPGRPLPADAGQITLLEADGLAVQQSVGVLDSLALVLPFLFAGCGALAVYLAPERMRAGAILALGER